MPFVVVVVILLILLIFYSCEAKDHKENQDCLIFCLKHKILKKRAVKANGTDTSANIYPKIVTITFVVSKIIALIYYDASKLNQHDTKLAQIENIFISAEFHF